MVSLLWRDDLDTAFRHLDLYDRFGCPSAHIQATFRCLVRQGHIDPKAPDSLNGRVHACWLNPGLAARPRPLPPQPPAATSGGTVAALTAFSIATINFIGAMRPSRNCHVRSLLEFMPNAALCCTAADKLRLSPGDGFKGLKSRPIWL